MIDPDILSAFDTDNPIRRRYEASIAAAQNGAFDNGCKKMRYYVLHQLARRAALERPSLNIAECGCWRGHSTHIIASVVAESGFQGQLAVFDSFEGLSEFQPEDLSHFAVDEQSREVRRKHFASSLPAVTELLAGFPFVRIFPGWIPARFSEVATWDFSHVSIDVDLYQPTVDSLNFFYPRLAPGGTLFLDDYGYKDYPGAKLAIDRFFEGRCHTLFVELPYGSAIVVK